MTDSSEISLLHIKDAQTISHPLLLLEGFCEEAGKRITKDAPQRLNPDSVEDRGLEPQLPSADSNISASLSNDFVITENNTTCTRWSVVGGGFKALVSLFPGMNRVKIKACVSNKWQEKEIAMNYQPLKLTRFVRVVYIKCVDADGTFQAPPGQPNDIDVARKKLALNARLLQTFTAHDLYQQGLGFRTFRLEENSEGQPLVHVFTSSLTTEEALKMTGGQLYDFFHAELTTSSLYDPKCKLWAFMSCTKYDPPALEDFNERDIPKYVRAHTALGGGRLALFGTGGLHTWASSADELVSCFTNTNMIDKRSLFDDSSRRGTYWANYATCLGASMHELGHCFDLAHTPAGIMGRGFDDMNCAFTMWKTPPHEETNKNLISGAPPVNAEESKEEFQAKRAKLEQVPICEAFPTAATLIQVSSTPAVRPRVTHEAQSSQRTAKKLDASSADAHVNKRECGLSLPGDISHGARWYRSSAVLLRYHKWLCGTDHPDASSTSHPIIHWSRNVRGPVGNFSSSAQPNQTVFNDARWLANQGFKLGGYIIHAGEFVNCIQTIGRDYQGEQCTEHLSEPQGSDSIGQRYEFRFTEEDEHLVSVDVRAGGWIDAIRFHTNVKSSVWMGGTGGDVYELKPSATRSVTGLFGTAGKYVGSIGAMLSGNASDDKNLIVDAPHGLRLIELHNKIHSEVYKHWEFLGDLPPRESPLPRDDIMRDEASIQIIDDRGNICKTGYVYDYTDALSLES